MLVKATLAAQIKAVLDAESDAPNIDPAAARQRTADGIADAIDAYIKTATINYLSGLVSPSGPVTGAFVGTLS